MTPTPCVMLLIDADNVSADVIEQAFERTLAEHGCIHVRRAYCNAETALKQQALFKRLSIRPMVNISAGKNSTDIALAVDAMDIVVSERPDVVVLVSSDSDFAPLVIRLREKGCRVCGIGQRGKTGEETVEVYDSFVDLAHRSSTGAASRAVRTSARSAGRRTGPERRSPERGSRDDDGDADSEFDDDAPPRRAPAAAPGTAASSRPASSPAPRATRAPRRSKAAEPPPPPPPARAPALPEDVLRILDAVPELAAGSKMELNQAAEQLRSAKLLGKSASSPKLFKKHPSLFELTPEKTPHKVRYIGPLAG